MKKNISIIILMFSILMIPFNVYAGLDTSLYKSENLEEVFTAEKIVADVANLAKYNTANDKRVDIYVFRLDGCVNCYNFYEYVANKLLASHGDKIRITSYELKNEPVNNNLLEAAKKLLNETSNITPIVFVGDKTFSGAFSSADKQKQLEDIINNLYNSNDRYDILEELRGERIFTDTTNKITLTSARSLNENYVLKADLIDCTNVNLELGYEYITAYDISMYHNSTKILLNNGVYKIKIPINVQYDKYKVGYVENGQIKESFEATNSNGYVEFTTTHLSEYVVYGMNYTNPNPNPKPDTKPSTNPDILSNIDGNNQENVDKTSTIGKTVSNPKNIVNIKNPKTLDTVEIYTILLVVGGITFIQNIELFRSIK